MDLKIAKVTIKNLRTRKAKSQSIAGKATLKKPLKSTVTALRAKAKKKADRKLAALQKKLKARKQLAMTKKPLKPGQRRIQSSKVATANRNPMFTGAPIEGKEAKTSTKSVTKKPTTKKTTAKKTKTAANKTKKSRTVMTVEEEEEVFKEHQDYVDENIYEPLLKEFMESKQTEADENNFIEDLQDDIIAFYTDRGYIPDASYLADLAKDALEPIGYKKSQYMKWVAEIQNILLKKFRVERNKAFRSKKR